MRDAAPPIQVRLTPVEIEGSRQHDLPGTRLEYSAQVSQRKLCSRTMPTPVARKLQAIVMICLLAPVFLLATGIGVAAADQLKPETGESFKDCVDCPEMVVIPAGSFTMGSPQTEGPQHIVLFVQPFAMGKYVVTFAEWDSCVSGGGCSHRPSDQGWGRGRRPVINVSWDDAKEYARWLSEKTGKDYRLPSESEWEYTARAGTRTAYHTGESISPTQANFDNERQQTAEVGSYSPNSFGIYDVHGNVWEWVEDCWNDSYNGAPGDGLPWTTGICERRVERGGSWSETSRNIRSASRNYDSGSWRRNSAGFRIARTLTR